MDPSEISLKPVEPGHTAFLRKLYCVSRDFEMIHYPWGEEEKIRFLEWQFELQHQHYQIHYKNGNFYIICWKGKEIGRFYVYRQDHDIRLMDITLLRENRNNGIGTCVVSQLLEEARRKGARVSLHVEPNNPALSLYMRLGFKVKKTEGANNYMEWLPENYSGDD